jgi:hypothetical protein
VSVRHDAEAGQWVRRVRGRYSSGHENAGDPDITDKRADNR